MDSYFTVQSAQDKGPTQYGSHRWEVVFEEQEEVISMFSKFPIKVGDKLFGHIENVEKGGKTYVNFKFAKKDMSPAANDKIAGIAEIKNYLDLKIMPLLTKIHKEVVASNEKLGMPEDLDESDGFPRPRFDEKPPF